MLGQSSGQGALPLLAPPLAVDEGLAHGEHLSEPVAATEDDDATHLVDRIRRLVSLRVLGEHAAACPQSDGLHRAKKQETK